MKSPSIACKFDSSFYTYYTRRKSVNALTTRCKLFRDLNSLRNVESKYLLNVCISRGNMVH